MLGLKPSLKFGLALGTLLSFVGSQVLTCQAEISVADKALVHAIYTHPLQGNIQTVALPAETVINIALSELINSQNSINATVQSPVSVVPYLVVPTASIISGKITDINRKAQKEGPNPYIVVTFDRLSRPEDSQPIPLNAALITYKTGLQGEDYLWRMPQKKNKVRDRLGSSAEGALVGLFFNPIVGPVIGAGAGVLKSVAIDKAAQHGSIRIKAGQVIPIAVQDAFKVLVDTAQLKKRLLQRLIEFCLN